MKTKFYGVLTLWLLLMAQVILSQEKTISGNVSCKIKVLPGVAILKKGTTFMMDTDFHGNYFLSAKVGDTLVFSFTGMKTEERVVGASNRINIVLESDSSFLDEVVEVGYGETTKQSFTGTTKGLKAEKIMSKLVSNTSQALVGVVSGVNVINTSGQLGTEATIRIRGFGSVNGNRDPLYVVDGIPFSGSINSINPANIESITALKDAATAIYGARGANGVIMITTKSGKSGIKSIEVDIKTDINLQLLPRYDVIESPDKNIELSWHALGDRGVDLNPSSNRVAFANSRLLDNTNGGMTNAVGNAFYNFRGNNRHSLNGIFLLNINLFDRLELESQYGAQYFSNIDDNIANPFYGSARQQRGILVKTYSSGLTQNFLNILKYDKNFEHHNIYALLTHETNRRKFQKSIMRINKVVNLLNGLNNPNNYENNYEPASGFGKITASESYFRHITYNYKRKCCFTGSLRRDGSSRFFSEKWGIFNSLGISWVLSEEKFISNLSLIDFLKLKISYGVVGDQAGVDVYSGQDTHSIGNLDEEISLRPNQAENPFLTWEISKMFQVGIEFNLFNHRIDASLDYYVKNVDNLIFKKRMIPSTGNRILFVNDGLLRNTGLEFDVATHIIKNENFKLDLEINGEMFSSDLIEMPIDHSTGEQKVLDITETFGRASGKGLFDFYMREWSSVDSETGKSMWMQYYYDANHNNIFDSGEGITSLYEYTHRNPKNKISKTTTSDYTEATQKFIGKSMIPKIRGAFRLTTKIYDFSISTLFGYSLGGYAYDHIYSSLMSNEQIGAANSHIDHINSWKKLDDITDVPRVINDRDLQANSLSSRFIIPSDYLELRNVIIDYSVPKIVVKRASLDDLSISFSVDNLFLLTKRKEFNSMTSETGTSSVYRYKPLSTLSFGIKARF